MILRLIESDLHKLISSTVKKILKENSENNVILSKIVEGLSISGIPSKIGVNQVDIPLDYNGNVIACIDYEIEEKQGDYNVFIMSIVIDDDGKEFEIEDNGMVTNALKNLIEPWTEDVGYYEEDDDQSGWNENWK